MKIATTIVAFVVSLLIGFSIAYFQPTSTSAAIPPRAGQPHSDTFVVAGYGDLQPFNPVSQKLKNQPTNARVINYGLRVASGCSLGSIASDLQILAQQNNDALKFVLQRNDSVNDFVIIINCGNTQIQFCGSINIFCLPYGFPYKNDVSISDILVTYPAVTRRAILWHEIIGHAIATFNEQYCLGGETTGVCAGQAQFASAPNWQDIMNTGPDSRRDIGDCPICVERWERVMYEINTITCSLVGWDECSQRWRFNDGWSWSPSEDIWYDPLNRARWAKCNQDNFRLDLLDQHWWAPAEQYRGFDYSINQHVTVPSCN